MTLPLSVLDVTPIAAGTSGPQALRNTLDLARHVDRLGYVRYWLAEHHNLPTLASSAPEVMIAHVATETRHLHVGAGGIMLPNHAPLKVVETFRVLEALHPGRIDLGIGRAPGTDGVTAMALRRSHAAVTADDFPEQFAELLAFSSDGFPERHPFRSVSAMPKDVALPPIWLLGSSGYSAQAAGEMGFGYGFASHFSPADPVPPMLAYREHFQPSDRFEKPSAILAVAVICGEDDEQALFLASSTQLYWVQLRSGAPSPIRSPEEASTYRYNPAEERLAEAFRSMQVIGGPATVRARLEELAERTAADELMITTNVYSHEERKRSYERVARVFGLQPPDDSAVPSDPA
jgi:luciferase family oxidoreductase group 1